MGTSVVVKRKFRRKRVRLWYLLVTVVFLWGGYVYLFVQRPVLAQQAADKAKLSSALNLSKLQYRNLNRQVINLHQNSYIAYVAQKKYNLVTPGEVLFVSK